MSEGHERPVAPQIAGLRFVPFAPYGVRLRNLQSDAANAPAVSEFAANRAICKAVGTDVS